MDKKSEIWKNMENMDPKMHDRRFKSSGKRVLRGFQAVLSAQKKYGFP